MKIIIIRHADPDYINDSLTEKGFKEAELLSQRISKMKIDEIWCSPLGRAKATAKPSLEKLGMQANIADWLREFDGKSIDPDTGEETRPWDFLPRCFKDCNTAFDSNRWQDSKLYNTKSIIEKYRDVCEGLDEIFAKHGYIKKGRVYETEQGNEDVIAFFCHYGIESFMLSHILNFTPIIFLQNFVALPSSVTILTSEEREKGTAIFRCSHFGDTSHLYKADEPLSFSARFCEIYESSDRH